MKNEIIRVGIIGVDPNRGWASLAHIPAIRQFAEFKITALSNPSKEKALAAAAKFNIAHAFDDVNDLVQSSEVDLVVISVKVPFHKELTAKAIKAGKHVYCEWPLGNGLIEALQMQELAEKQPIQAFVGLQSQTVPSISYIKHLVKDGYVGKVLSTSIVAFGGMLATDEANAYTLDVKNGASLLTISFGATIHAVCHCLGDFASVTATTATVNEYGIVAASGRRVPITMEDQIAVTGVLENGAVASVHYRAGQSVGPNFVWEINGTDGDLIITADGGHVAFYPLTIKAAKKTQDHFEIVDVPEQYYKIPKHVLQGPAYHLAQHYGLVLNDLKEGTKLAPRFGDAVIRHKLLDAIQKSSVTGQRQYLSFNAVGLTK